MENFRLEREAAETARETKETEAKAPVLKELPCVNARGTDFEKDLSVLDQISKLPEKVQLEILRRFSLDQLFNLKPSMKQLRLILPFPLNEDFEIWFGKFLAKQNSGFIYIPQENRMFMSNRETIEDYYDTSYEGSEDSLRVSNISPALESGIYKVRMLQGGFDLVKVGCNFISSQCGPLNCYHTELGANWASSFISRGFGIKTEDRSDLSWNWRPTKSWRLQQDQGYVRRGPVFFFSTKEGFWNKPWKQKVIKPYNVDDVAQLAQIDDEDFEELVLRVLNNNNRQVVGYTISGMCLYAYDPEGYPHSDEGAYNFSVSRYCYSTSGNNMVGFIITGEQNMYGMPHVLLEDGIDFPDRKNYQKFL